MSGPLILGIDPGLTGAAVLYAPRTGELEFVVFGEACLANTKDAALRVNNLAVRAALVVLERNSARPASKDGGKGQGVASAFNFGFSCGFLAGVVATHPNFRQVLPAVWKAKLGLSADKAECCLHAAKLFPRYREFFFGPRGGPRDGPAEAALLAYWGAMLLGVLKHETDEVTLQWLVG